MEKNIRQRFDQLEAFVIGNLDAQSERARDLHFKLEDHKRLMQRLLKGFEEELESCRVVKKVVKRKKAAKKGPKK